MIKMKTKSRKTKGIALFEMLLMISFTIVISILMSQNNIVSGAAPADSGTQALTGVQARAGETITPPSPPPVEPVANVPPPAAVAQNTPIANAPAALSAAPVAAQVSTGLGGGITQVPQDVLQQWGYKEWGNSMVAPNGNMYALSDAGSAAPTADLTSYQGNLYTTNTGEYNTLFSSSGGGAAAPEAAAATNPTQASFFSQHPIQAIFGGKADFGMTGTAGGVAGTLVAGLAWAGVAYLAVTLIGSLIGLKKGAEQALQYAALGGGFTAGALHAVGANSLSGSLPSWLTTGFGPIGAGLAIAAVIFIFTYKSQRVEVLNYQCLPYEPPIGGQKCEECNKDPMRPCSEYRCKSLGQACELLNAGTGQEKCAWVSKFDVESPTIQPWKQVLTDGLRYDPDNTIRPPNRGVKIVDTTDAQGCLPAFTKLQFGVTLDKPARCKIDFTRVNGTGQDAFDSMQYYMGDNNLFDYNHTQQMRLPSPNATGVDFGPILTNGASTNLYVKCMDANGNVNVDDFVFSFCVKNGPDTTPPIIESTSINNNAFVQYNADHVPIDIYVNEPSECKWSRIDKDYTDMENQMGCATQTYQINSQLTYTCSANLTSIQNEADNTFYFRCKDQPGKPDSERNTNSQSFVLNLKGSRQLNIDSITPNESIRGSTEVVPVTLEVHTSAGAEDGSAVCSFSTTGQNDSWIQMFDTSNYISRQTLDLTGSSTGTPYQYYFRCVDAGGNAAYGNTAFTLFVDKDAPIVTRVYKEIPDALKIVTNEDAQCVYSLTTCNYNFADGTQMLYPDPNVLNVLAAQWKSNAFYYIKCKDKYDNQPSANVCSIVANAIELTQNQTAA